MPDIPASTCGRMLEGLKKLSQMESFHPGNRNIFKVNLDDSYVATLNVHDTKVGILPAGTALILNKNSYTGIQITAEGGELLGGDETQPETINRIIWARVRELQ